MVSFKSAPTTYQFVTPLSNLYMQKATIKTSAKLNSVKTKQE